MIRISSFISIQIYFQKIPDHKIKQILIDEDRCTPKVGGRDRARQQHILVFMYIAPTNSTFIRRLSF